MNNNLFKVWDCEEEKTLLKAAIDEYVEWMPIFILFYLLDRPRPVSKESNRLKRYKLNGMKKIYIHYHEMSLIRHHRKIPFAIAKY